MENDHQRLGTALLQATVAYGERKDAADGLEKSMHAEKAHREQDSDSEQTAQAEKSRRTAHHMLFSTYSALLSHDYVPPNQQALHLSATSAHELDLLCVSGGLPATASRKLFSPMAAYTPLSKVQVLTSQAPIKHVGKTSLPKAKPQS